MLLQWRYWAQLIILSSIFVQLIISPSQIFELPFSAISLTRPPRTEVKADPDASDDEQQEEPENEQGCLRSTQVLHLKQLTVFWTCSSWRSNKKYCSTCQCLHVNKNPDKVMMAKLMMMMSKMTKTPLHTTFSETSIMNSDVHSWTGNVGFVSLVGILSLR